MWTRVVLPVRVARMRDAAASLHAAVPPLEPIALAASAIVLLPDRAGLDL